MRRVTSALGTLLLAGAAIAIPVQPASAHNGNHTVTVSGVMIITDDENWPQSDQHKTVTFNGNVVVGPNLGTASYTATGCAGGEVRVEVQVTVSHDPVSQSVWVDPLIRMFEGTSCSSNDLDGTVDVPGGWIATSGQGTYTVRNTAEGGDSASVQLTVANQVH